MDPEQEVREFQREYLDFLDDGVSIATLARFFQVPKTCTSFQDDTGVYYDKVREMVRTQARRLIVNINDLRRKNPKRAVK